MPRYKLLISYDGTEYFGWQKTEAGPSIQGSLETAIKKSSQETPLPEAASRTDRGVHAEGQVVSFMLEKSWEPGRFLKALNAWLPEEIRVLHVEKASSEFHPTLEAKEKIYCYHVDLKEVHDPLLRNYSWHYFYPIDLSLMKRAKENLVGTLDFSSFCNRKEKNPICTLSSIEFSHLEGDTLLIELRGDRFLYKMARNLVGLLLYVGSGKIAPEEVPLILESRDRKRGGITAPAKGLFLKKVLY